MNYLRGKRASYFGNLRTLERTHGFRKFRVNSVILLSKIFIIIFLYMVATNSINIQKFQPIADTDYILLLDDSSSMANTDLKPNRLSAAKDISKRWLDILPNNTAVGLVTFSRGIDFSIGVTSDREAVEQGVNAAVIDYEKTGTDLDYAINFALDSFNETSREKRILLFTDGAEGVENDTISKANDKNIKIYSFGIGDPNKTINLTDVPEEFLDIVNTQQFNFSLLADLSNQTNGNAYLISNEEELEESFEKATLEQIEVGLNTGYYVTILIALFSILELLIYAKLGAL